MIPSIPDLWCYFCSFAVTLSLVTYLLPQIALKFRQPQNLKEKYGETCKWALVTGGSSGIGKAIVETLARQGINVVVLAYPDETLDKSCAYFEKEWPNVKFRKVGANLAGDYLDDLIKRTDDIDISLVFNNAGFLRTGFFADLSLEAHMANHHCNTTSAVQITHVFLKKMQEKKLKGCITFTSSPAGFMTCPFSSIYGSTKAYLTEFAVSVGAEVRCDGIDVCVLHPSPVASNFYLNQHDIDALKLFKSTAAGPQKVVDALFASIGRSLIRDQGYYPTSVKLLTKLVDFNFMADVVGILAPYLPDFKNMKALSAKKQG